MPKKKTAAENPQRFNDYTNKITQDRANNLLQVQLSSLSTDENGQYWKYINQEHQKDKGIDYHVEIEDAGTGATLFTFHIQNKGCSKKMVPLVTTDNKGLLAYAISIRHTKYYRYEIQAPMVFTVCDIASGKVYWHTVQLDDSLDNLLQSAGPKDKYLRIYIDPKKELNIENVSALIADLKSSYQQQKVRFLRNLNHDLFAYHPKVNIDRSKHIVDQLYDYLSYTHKSLRFVPIQMLVGNYPFKVKKTYYPHYSNFSLTTDNEDLLAMLSKVDVKDHKEITIVDAAYFTGVEHLVKKLCYIFQTLSNNLIFEIQANHHSEPAHFHLYSDEVQLPSEKFFDELKFIELFQYLVSAEPSTDRERMAVAYAHYQLGNYLTSAEQFNQMSKTALKEKKLELFFICRFNLSKLARLLRLRDFRGITDSPLVKEIRAINIDDDFETYKNPENENLLNWIRELKFLTRAEEQIRKTLKSIKDQYYGGLSSTTDYAKEMMCVYAALDQSINMNHIIIDIFQEFRTTFDHVIEGWFGALSSRYQTNWRLPFLDVWMMHRIVFYGKRGQIISHVNRYRLKELRYQAVESNALCYTTIINSFLEEGPEAYNLFETMKEKNNDHFHDLYLNLYDNLILLAAITTLTKEQVAIVSKQIRKYIASGGMANFFYESINISMFFQHQKEKLPVSEIREWLQLFIATDRIHNMDLFENLCLVAKQNEWMIELTDEEFLKLKSISLDEWPVATPRLPKPYLLYAQPYLASESQRMAITERIKEMLEISFDVQVCYDALISDVIPMEPKLFDQLIKEVNPGTRRGGVGFGFKDEEYVPLPHLSELLNLCFKYDIPLSDLKFDAFIADNEYYQWLFGIDSYDYQKWNPRWIGQYPTMYFFKEFRRHPIIKQELEKYLTDRSDTKVERLYFDVYSDVRKALVD